MNIYELHVRAIEINHLLQFFRDSGFKPCNQQQFSMSLEGSFYVEPRFSQDDWCPEYAGDGKEVTYNVLIFHFVDGGFGSHIIQ